MLQEEVLLLGWASMPPSCWPLLEALDVIWTMDAIRLLR